MKVSALPTGMGALFMGVESYAGGDEGFMVDSAQALVMG